MHFFHLRILLDHKIEPRHGTQSLAAFRAREQVRLRTQRGRAFFSQRAGSRPGFFGFAFSHETRLYRQSLILSAFQN
jgi:hypothetical protein